MIQGLLCHAKVTTTLDLYSQSIDASKLIAQKDIALASTSNGAHPGQFTGSKITALVLGWVEDSVLRSDSRGFGVAGSSSRYGVASIV